jgi:YVTN family beta-propeller protein
MINTSKRPTWLGCVVAALVLGTWTGRSLATATNSSPIAITPDNKFVWMVNPENNNVSIFKVEGDANTRIALLETGKEPQSVAIHPTGTKAYVTNMVSGTVSVFRIDPSTGLGTLCNTLGVGTEPYGAVVTPDGKELYVANASSDDVTIINVNTKKDPEKDPDCGPNGKAIIKTLKVGNDPRGLAVTEDGSKVYATHFFSLLRPGKTPGDEGRDDSREGRVTVISTKFHMVLGTVTLNPLADTGFKSDGSTLDRVSCQATGCPNQLTVTGAFPSLMQSIVIKGERAYLPSIGASPNGPFRFNVNVQAFLSVFDITTDQDSGQTINMNSGIQNESQATKLFLSHPHALAFKQAATEGFVVAKGINQIIRVELDANGTPTVNAPTPVRVNVGADPRGIVFNSTDTRAYVMNFISRDMTVVNISNGLSPSVLGTVAQSDLLPTPGSLEADVHRGKELFNAAIGPAGTTGASLPPAGRMSNAGWGSCYGCHEDGRTDTNTWMFADGPRQSIDMSGTGNGGDLDHPRVLNWSAVRDECQDFERNIIAVSGGEGLIGVGLANTPDLTPIANTGRNADLDKLCLYLQVGVRARIAPETKFKASVASGREVFAEAGCATCHGGPAWSNAIRDFTPPPDPAVEPICDAQLVRFIDPVGTFDATLFTNGTGNEIRANTVLVNVEARGGDGFGLNPPSLLGVFASAPYFHNGSALTLEDVIAAAPRNAEDVHFIPVKKERTNLLRFLQTIDNSTEPFPLVPRGGETCP